MSLSWDVLLVLGVSYILGEICVLDDICSLGEVCGLGTFRILYGDCFLNEVGGILSRGYALCDHCTLHGGIFYVCCGDCILV